MAKRGPSRSKTGGAAPKWRARGGLQHRIRRDCSDNGPFGTHTVRFETGPIWRSAGRRQQSPYLGWRHIDKESADDHRGKTLKDQFDFFPPPWTSKADVRRAYPGSFFRREASQPGRHPHLPSHRPAAAPDLRQGLRNEVQVVITVQSLNPTTPTTCWPSTPRRCPPSCPACRSAARSAPCAWP